MVRRLAAAAVVLTAGVTASPGHADPGPFTALAGTWGGSGTVALEDGSTERIRCRARYGVSGPRMTLVLTCASDAYKFALQAEVIAEGSAISGTWSESSRGISGVLQGRGGGGNFQLVATTAGFNANIALATRGNRQSVSIRADSQFRAANISMSR
ncbi:MULTISPECIES: hypothetical protein [unclassified Bradyrhizobium]|uniref:hypothetical protein n=1 Tax=unclassified Bradyrhizobium TaxID=2631580 RepID=UPI0028E50643|nr:MULTISPECIES: hypothetical protein [unclassified Bradyrhizobium]